MYSFKSLTLYHFSLITNWPLDLQHFNSLCQKQIEIIIIALWLQLSFEFDTNLLESFAIIIIDDSCLLRFFISHQCLCVLIFRTVIKLIEFDLEYELRIFWLFIKSPRVFDLFYFIFKLDLILFLVILAWTRTKKYGFQNQVSLKD